MYTSLCRLGFATYLLAILLYIFVIRYGAWFTVTTGLVMILACFSFGLIIYNDPEFKIPFQDGVLEPEFGWSWYLVLFTGIATLFLGIFIIGLDYLRPEWTATIFHHSITHDDEFFQVSLNGNYCNQLITLCGLYVAIIGVSLSKPHT